MVVKIASLTANLELEEKGEWRQVLDLIPDEDVWFRVSSINLPAFTIAREHALQRLARRYKDTPIPQAVANATMGKLMAVHLLHEWKGFDLPYSKEASIELLSNPANRLLIQAVQSCAGQVGAIDIEFVEDEVKNSGKPSAKS